MMRQKAPGDYVCGIVRNIGRDGESAEIMSLAELLEIKKLTCSRL